MVSDLYRKFVDNEIMPVRHLIDDDKDHKLIKKILQAMTDIGHQKAAFPEEYGGSNMILTLPAPIIHEELGRGDSGRCFSMTEPGGPHGGGVCDIENPTLEGKKIRTIAKLEGNEWVINGRKMWGSNAGDADVYCVLCTTDPNLGDEGIALIYVPADAKGLSFGKFENKAGMESDRNCAMFLDNVRVPK